MHLSSEEILQRVWSNPSYQVFERWEEEFGGPRTVVLSHECATETQDTSRVADGRREADRVRREAGREFRYPLYTAVGQHSDGCPCYETREDRWPES